jgi:hypothetical protein
MRSLVTRATRSEALDPHVASCRIVGGVEEHLTVGRVAGLAGVTVRTLHHYDEIGLVRPSARTAAGYRAYSAGDVERLREVAERWFSHVGRQGGWVEKTQYLVVLVAGSPTRR